jgi:membrane protein involved in colicin uptake
VQIRDLESRCEAAHARHASAEDAAARLQAALSDAATSATNLDTALASARAMAATAEAAATAAALDGAAARASASKEAALRAASEVAAREARDAVAAATAKAEAAAASLACNAAASAAADTALHRVEAAARAVLAAGISTGSSALRGMVVTGDAWAKRTDDGIMFQVLEMSTEHIKVCVCNVQLLIRAHDLMIKSYRVGPSSSCCRTVLCGESGQRAERPAPNSR